MVDEGCEVITEFFRDWVSEDPNQDVDMPADDDEAAEAELARLRSFVDKYRDRFEANPWIQSLLTLA